MIALRFVVESIGVPETFFVDRASHFAGNSRRSSHAAVKHPEAVGNRYTISKMAMPNAILLAGHEPDAPLSHEEKLVVLLRAIHHDGNDTFVMEDLRACENVPADVEHLIQTSPLKWI